MLDRLPVELFPYFTQYLSIKDNINVSEASKNCFEKENNKFVWKSLSERDFPEKFKSNDISWKEHYINNYLPKTLLNRMTMVEKQTYEDAFEKLPEIGSLIGRVTGGISLLTTFFGANWLGYKIISAIGEKFINIEEDIYSNQTLALLKIVGISFMASSFSGLMQKSFYSPIYFLKTFGYMFLLLASYKPVLDNLINIADIDTIGVGLSTGILLGFPVYIVFTKVNGWVFNNVHREMGKAANLTRRVFSVNLVRKPISLTAGKISKFRTYIKG